MVARWRYALPSIITCASICSALLSMSEAIAGRFESCAWLIVLCTLLDKADGTLARILRASSRFGVQLDSLSDLVAFGVAPAVLILAALVGHDSGAPLASDFTYRVLVYFACIFFVVAAAVRLARFNILTESYRSEFFFGIPTTVCGAFVASYFLTAKKFGLSIFYFEVIPPILILLSLLMVSRVPLPKMGRRKTRLWNTITLINVFFVFLFGILRLFPEYLFAVCVTYGVGGSIWALSQGVKAPNLVSLTSENSLANRDAPEGDQAHEKASHS
jgi:CDP-diacylglycerol---serine O-phosphatidyltransferase